MLLSLALATCLVCGEATYLQAQDEPFAGWVECVRKVDAKGSTLRVCIVGTSDDDRVLYVAMTREDAANPASTFAVEKTVRPLGYELSSVRLMDARLLPYLTEDEDFHDLEHRAPSRYYLGTWL